MSFTTYVHRLRAGAKGHSRHPLDGTGEAEKELMRQHLSDEAHTVPRVVDFHNAVRYELWLQFANLQQLREFTAQSPELDPLPAVSPKGKPQSDTIGNIIRFAGTATRTLATELFKLVDIIEEVSGPNPRLLRSVQVGIPVPLAPPEEIALFAWINNRVHAQLDQRQTRLERLQVLESARLAMPTFTRSSRVEAVVPVDIAASGEPVMGFFCIGPLMQPHLYVVVGTSAPKWGGFREMNSWSRDMRNQRLGVSARGRAEQHVKDTMEREQRDVAPLVIGLAKAQQQEVICNFRIREMGQQARGRLEYEADLRDHLGLSFQISDKAPRAPCYRCTHQWCFTTGVFHIHSIMIENARRRGEIGSHHFKTEAALACSESIAAQVCLE
ncbi:MAG: hypothetical protein M1831_007221 [Alyxoria varia]|nr:MAG: hypothetical protein M1831_007221 [Alyxoria varia]